MGRILARLMCIIGLLAPSQSMADAVSDFYRGKDISFIVAYDVGGGYDQYARLVGRHMSRHIPGSPNIIVQNMPGAGGIRATNNLYNVAPQNGTVLGMIDQAMPLQAVLEPENIKADMAKFNWIGRIASNGAILYVWHTSPVQDIQDAFSKELIISSSGQNSKMMLTFMKNQLGMKLNILLGYKGTGESRLALERGEIHALSQPWSVIRTESANWLKDRKIALLLQFGVDKHPELPSVPLIVDLGRNENERKLITLMAGGSRIGRSLVSPPGQPPERVAALRQAFMETVKDEAFLAEIKLMGLDLEPLSGDELQKFVETSSIVTPELAAQARALAGLGVK
jgi:tripartite-type tricarboxylate transporter receptor subunit TctC